MNRTPKRTVPLGAVLFGVVRVMSYETSMVLAAFFSSFFTFGRVTVRMPISTLTVMKF